MERKTGIIYYLKNFTAPKVYNGLYFECLLTDQKIPSHTKVIKSTGVHIKDWKHDIYKPERFGLNEAIGSEEEFCECINEGIEYWHSQENKYKCFKCQLPTRKINEA